MQSEKERFLDSVKKGDIQSVRSDLQNKRSLANAKDSSGVTALMLATTTEVGPELVDLLMKHGATIETRDSSTHLCM